MNDKSKLALFMCCSLIWFVFGTMVLVRGTKDEGSLNKYTGTIEKIGIANSVSSKRTVDILYFKLSHLEQTLGVYHNSIEDYDRYLKELKKGDQISVLFDKDGMMTGENFNLHVHQLEKNGIMLLSKQRLDATDKKVSLALYLTGLLFALPALWFYNKNF